MVSTAASATYLALQSKNSRVDCYTSSDTIYAARPAQADNRSDEARHVGLSVSHDVDGGCRDVGHPSDSSQSVAQK